MYGEEPAPVECDVLIVDDQLFHRDMCTEMLRAKGLRAEAVASGEEAIQLYSRLIEKPVVLMDNVMPRMTGIEATRAICAMDPKAKIIFVSSDVAHRQDALDAGALGFVSKPYKMNEVLSAVKWAKNHVIPDAPT